MSQLADVFGRAGPWRAPLRVSCRAHAAAHGRAHRRGLRAARAPAGGGGHRHRQDLRLPGAGADLGAARAHLHRHAHAAGPALQPRHAAAGRCARASADHGAAQGPRELPVPGEADRELGPGRIVPGRRAGRSWPSCGPGRTPRAAAIWPRSPRWENRTRARAAHQHARDLHRRALRRVRALPRVRGAPRGARGRPRRRQSSPAAGRPRAQGGRLRRAAARRRRPDPR